MAAKNSNLDRQFEEAVGSFFKFVGRTIAAIFKGLLRGIKKLNRWQAWIGVGISVITVCVGLVFKGKIMEIGAPVYIKWLLYYALLGAPVIYLLILGSIGSKPDQDYDTVFRDIGFLGKDGKCPCFCGEQKDGKKKILKFKSNIPLQEWKAAKARLETALDCNILKMEYGNSKKLVELTVLPADYKIPEMITWQDAYCSDKNGTITIGQSALDSITFNLNRVPHALVAGETGSGKSVILRCILWQMILQGSRVYMIDFKGGVEFGKQYEKYGEVITEREHALEVLDLLVRENDCRLRLFRDLEVKNLAEYNKKTGQNLCRIGVFSDELAEMLDKKGVAKEDKKVYEALEGRLSTLARLSRATGINLFLGVQRPDATVLTGQIKNNVPVRISGRFADKAASEIVLGNTDAVDLPDIKGRFLYKVGNETIEFQSYYFDDEKMLHDVDVEVGDMLTEAPVYKPEKVEESKKAEKPEKAQKLEKTQKTVRKRTRRVAKEETPVPKVARENFSEEELPFPLDSGMEELPFPPDSDEEELPFPPDSDMDADDFDLDLNF